ncbi:MAG: hypothetical protein LBJ70_05100 [Holosporales bacterium]|jgi:hypothetical protein|nr:hypothetical protein [Holosporales bacterium]
MLFALFIVGAYSELSRGMDTTRVGSARINVKYSNQGLWMHVVGGALDLFNPEATFSITIDTTMMCTLTVSPAVAGGKSLVAHNSSGKELPYAIALTVANLAGASPALDVRDHHALTSETRLPLPAGSYELTFSAVTKEEDRRRSNIGAGELVEGAIVISLRGS